MAQRSLQGACQEGGAHHACDYAGALRGQWAEHQPLQQMGCGVQGFLGVDRRTAEGPREGYRHVNLAENQQYSWGGWRREHWVAMRARCGLAPLRPLGGAYRCGSWGPLRGRWRSGVHGLTVELACQGEGGGGSVRGGAERPAWGTSCGRERGTRYG